MKGVKVKVKNPFLYTYPLEGIMVSEKKLPGGNKKYKVQFPDFAGAIWLNREDFVIEK